MTKNTDTRSLVSVWQTYIEMVKQYDWAPPEIIEDGDIAYLKSIGAHSELIETAKLLPGINSVYWAPMSEMREYTSDAFAHSLVISDDGCGNYIHWMDVRDANSKIVYLCHDPAVIMVIANSAVEWLDGLIEGLKSPTLVSKEESDWGNFLENTGLDDIQYEIWKTSYYNGENDVSGLKKTIAGDLTHLDFTNAHVGTGVSLRFNGKYTTLETGKKAGILRLGTQSQSQIKSQRLSNVVIYGLMIVCFIGLFYYYNQMVGKKLVSSFVSSLAALFVLFIVLGLLYSGYELLKERLKPKP